VTCINALPGRPQALLTPESEGVWANLVLTVAPISDGLLQGSGQRRPAAPLPL